LSHVHERSSLHFIFHCYSKIIIFPFAGVLKDGLLFRETHCPAQYKWKKPNMLIRIIVLIKHLLFGSEHILQNDRKAYP